QLYPQVLAQRQSPFDRAAIGLRAVRQIRAGERLFREQIDAHARSKIEKIWLRVTEFDAADKLAIGHASLGKAAGTQQVAFGHRNFRQPAVGGRIAALNGEVAGRLLLDVDVDDDAIRRRARLVSDFHVLEEVQTFDAPLGAIDQRAIVRIAFVDIEFATDHVIAGPIVAAYVDALNIGPRAFVDDQQHADCPR